MHRDSPRWKKITLKSLGKWEVNMMNLLCCSQNWNKWSENRKWVQNDYCGAVSYPSDKNIFNLVLETVREHRCLWKRDHLIGVNFSWAIKNSSQQPWVLRSERDCLWYSAVNISRSLTLNWQILLATFFLIFSWCASDNMKGLTPRPLGLNFYWNCSPIRLFRSL